MDPSGHLVQVLTNVTILNGVGWSPDDSTMYYVDTMTYGLDALEFDSSTGELGSRRRVATIDESLGLPDGLSVDEEGCIWSPCGKGGPCIAIQPRAG